VTAPGLTSRHLFIFGHGRRPPRLLYSKVDLRVAVNRTSVTREIICLIEGERSASSWCPFVDGLASSSGYQLRFRRTFSPGRTSSGASPHVGSEAVPVPDPGASFPRIESGDRVVDRAQLTAGREIHAARDGEWALNEVRCGLWECG
jgi:hypothetical protein